MTLAETPEERDPGYGIADWRKIDWRPEESVYIDRFGQRWVLKVVADNADP